MLRLIFAELGASSIPSSFVVPKVHKVFDQNANLLDDTYDKSFLKSLSGILKPQKSESKRYSILRNKKRSYNRNLSIYQSNRWTLQIWRMCDVLQISQIYQKDESTLSK
jgi:hypothetical protein